MPLQAPALCLQGRLSNRRYCRHCGCHLHSEPLHRRRMCWNLMYPYRWSHRYRYHYYHHHYHYHYRRSQLKSQL